MVLKDDKATMVIRLKGGEFPNYNAIVNSIRQENKLEIERIPFLDSLKRINLFTEDNFHTIKISIENNKMVLSSQNAELGNAKVANVVLLGALAAQVHQSGMAGTELTFDTWLKVIQERVPKKYVEINQQAFKAGWEIVKK